MSTYGPVSRSHLKIFLDVLFQREVLKFGINLSSHLVCRPNDVPRVTEDDKGPVGDSSESGSAISLAKERHHYCTVRTGLLQRSRDSTTPRSATKTARRTTHRPCTTTHTLTTPYKEYYEVCVSSINCGWERTLGILPTRASWLQRSRISVFRRQVGLRLSIYHASG